MPPVLHDVGEDLETGAADDVGDVLQLQAEADVRFVQAVARHGLVVGEARKGQCQRRGPTRP